MPSIPLVPHFRGDEGTVRVPPKEQPADSCECVADFAGLSRLTVIPVDLPSAFSHHLLAI